MNITISCPIFEREWILPRWYKCILEQGFDCKNIDLVFGVTDGDDGTREVIREFETYFNSTTIIECNDLPSYRDRNPERFFPLAEIRNRILSVVRTQQPEYWFSYDTDIMIPGDCLKTLYTDIQREDVDIVAPWVDLVPPAGIPNCATRRQNSDHFWRRKPYSMYYPKDGVYEVGTVFAIFLASPKVYEYNYGWHQGGEDYYWGNQMIDNGIRSWMDGNTVCNHIYGRDF